MSYLESFHTFNAEIEIDTDEIVEYVKENAEYFKERLGYANSETMNEIEQKISELLDKHYNIRKLRDRHYTTDGANLFTDVENLLKYIQELNNE